MCYASCVHFMCVVTVRLSSMNSLISVPYFVFLFILM